MNVADILKALQESKADASPVIDSRALALLWEAGLRKHFPIVKPVTQKEARMLKLWIAEIGPDRSVLAVEFLLSNWGRFADEVTARKGLEIAPKAHVVKFAHDHFDVLLDLLGE